MNLLSLMLITGMGFFSLIEAMESGFVIKVKQTLNEGFSDEYVSKEFSQIYSTNNKNVYKELWIIRCKDKDRMRVMEEEMEREWAGLEIEYSKDENGKRSIVSKEVISSSKAREKSLLLNEKLKEQRELGLVI